MSLMDEYEESCTCDLYTEDLHECPNAGTRHPSGWQGWEDSAMCRCCPVCEYNCGMEI